MAESENRSGASSEVAPGANAAGAAPAVGRGPLTAGALPRTTADLAGPIRVTADRLNVRKTPEIEPGNLVGGLDQGHVVQAVARHGDWIKILFGRGEGFVSESFVEPAALAPGASPAPAAAATGHASAATPPGATSMPTAAPATHTAPDAAATPASVPGPHAVAGTSPVHAPIARPSSPAASTPAAPTPGPPAPTAPAPTAPAPEEAYHAASKDRNPAAPAARNATEEQIHTAATDSKSQGALDIAWIDALPDALKQSIDGAFSDAAKDATFKTEQKSDAGLKTIDREVAEQLQELRSQTVERLTAADPKFAKLRAKEQDSAIAKDAEYRAQKNRVEEDRKTRREKREAEMKDALDGPMPAGAREDTVVTPSAKTMTRLEGKALARTNFMSWAVDVLGSSANAKRHFQSMREVSRQPGFYLMGKAADRFEAARAAFEAAHPNYTFPTTDTALQLRGLHQARQGIGMLGHALGVAFDLLAYDNPNQKIAQTANYGYLLDKFGGQGDKRGRSIMTLGAGADDKIAAMGTNTANHTPSVDDDAMIEKIRTQFDEMAATSDRLRASMADHLDELSRGRDLYFNSKQTESDLAKATADEKNGDAVAAQRLKGEKFKGDASERAARVAAIKAELTERKTQLAADLETAKTGVRESLRVAFADWVTSIKSDIAAAEARKASSEAELAAQAAIRDKLDAIDPASPGADAQLDAFAVEQKLAKPRQKISPKAYKALLQGELRTSQKPRSATDPKSPEYIRGEIAELNGWLAKLADPARVFGSGYRVPRPAPAASNAASASAATQANAGQGTSGAATAGAPAPTTPTASAPPGAAVTAATSASQAPAPSATSTTPTPAAATTPHWATTKVASDASVMQLLESGFVRHDAMPERKPQDGAKQVFNAELATTLARYGFSPGATFRDTMHFDFIEGYAASPGGRSMSNMNHNKYGPSGDLPEPTKAKGSK